MPDTVSVALLFVLSGLVVRGAGKNGETNRRRIVLTTT